MQELERIKQLKQKYEIVISTLGEDYEIIDLEHDYKQIMTCKALVNRYKRKLQAQARNRVKSINNYSINKEESIFNTLINKGKVVLFNGGVY